MFTYEFRVDGVLTDVTSLKFSNPTGTYGMRAVDTLDILIADGVDWSHPSTGTYTYDESGLDLEDEAIYDYWIEALYNGEYVRVQRFITGENVELEDIPLRFTCVKELAYVELETVPVLEAPTATYGVARTDTKEIVAAAGTEFVADGTLYSASFAEPEDGLKYIYYVKVELDSITYYVPRTNVINGDSYLAIGRYTDSTRVERMFGFENTDQWLATDEGDLAIDFAMRAAQFIDDAEDEIDTGLGRSYYRGDGLEGDFEDGVPKLITQLATMLAGVMMYEAKGVTQYDPNNNQTQHRFRWHRKKVEDTLKKLRNGTIRLRSGVSTPEYPVAYVSEPDIELPDFDIRDPFNLY